MPIFSKILVVCTRGCHQAKKIVYSLTEEGTTIYQECWWPVVSSWPLQLKLQIQLCYSTCKKVVDPSDFPLQLEMQCDEPKGWTTFLHYGSTCLVVFLDTLCYSQFVFDRLTGPTCNYSELQRRILSIRRDSPFCAREGPTTD